MYIFHMELLMRYTVYQSGDKILDSRIYTLDVTSTAMSRLRMGQSHCSALQLQLPSMSCRT
ncbi:hypothetical protein EVA_17543 [gut metagenome]|uniref:Uncharacterized protein n=1 Tax=gut metagenome TaxID=749906 RepID=J9FHF5_9ZZZZ